MKDFTQCAPDDMYSKICSNSPEYDQVSLLEFLGLAEPLFDFILNENLNSRIEESTTVSKSIVELKSTFTIKNIEKDASKLICHIIRF